MKTGLWLACIAFALIGWGCSSETPQSRYVVL
jgi:hypothetical protein